MKGMADEITNLGHQGILRTLNLLPSSETKRLPVSQGIGMVTPGDTELGPQSRPLLSKESFRGWAWAFQALGPPT